MESISDKLKSLGFKVATSISTPVNKTRISLERAVSGVLLTNSLGSFVVKEELYPFGYSHGKVLFSENIIDTMLRKVARIENTDFNLSNLVFLDTETTGLSGGSGTFAFLVGIGRFLQNGFFLQQFIIKEPQEESAMLLHLGGLLDGEDVFVTFNGKSFDIPLLNTRLILNKLPFNFRSYLHLDLLHLSRRLWKNKLESCALKDLEREILLLERSEEEIPGWMIPETYFDYLRTGDSSKLANVMYHNAQDIVSLAALFIHISEILEKNIDFSGISAEDLISIAKIFSDLKSYDISEKIYTKCLDFSMTDTEAGVVNHYLGMYYKNRAEFDVAEKHWKIAAKKGNYDSCIELAMLYEHHSKNPAEAILWALNGSEILKKT